MASAQKAYHTSLATEFYVLSVLHRLGVDATLTLGNRKGVDIVVVAENGDAITVEAKGANDTTGWWVKNVVIRRSDHYVVFVTYKKKIDDIFELPECWIVPSDKLDTFIRPNPKNKVVGRDKLIEHGQEFKDAWDPIIRFVSSRAGGALGAGNGAG